MDFSFFSILGEPNKFWMSSLFSKEVISVLGPTREGVLLCVSVVSDSYKCLVEMAESAFWHFCPIKEGKNRSFDNFWAVYAPIGFIFGG